ncbi:MAG: OmpH family outer membrane protein [Bacteroidales bacterium]|jgi:outer membrane protein|nr:OmpH family outer membrane protein [Bacteroidales bacterium]
MKKILLFAVMAFISAAAFAQPKFAHVNFTELYQLMPEADQARATMTAAQNEAQEVYQSMMEEYQNKVTTYQQKSSTWTQTIRESKEKEINDVQQRIMEFEQSIQQELAAKQNELMAPLVQKAQETVNSLAKAGSYIFVFDTSQMLYIDPAQSTDLTPAARKALNIAEGRTLESLQAELQAAAQAQQ